VTDRKPQARLLQWIGYGQYGFMAALAVLGILFSLTRGMPGSAQLSEARWQAVGFAVAFAVLLAYSLWRLFKHFLRYR